MSSYRSISSSKQPIPPSRRRSSSGVRSNGASSTYNRSPRSISSYTGAVTSPYSSGLTGSTAGYSSAGYNSPYYPNTYRSSATSPGTYSASLSIPTKSLVSGLNNSTSYARKYDSGRYSTSGGSADRRSRDLGRSGSYRSATGDAGRSSHSRSRSAGPAGSAMGSRSTSLTSLNSEGYVSGTDRSISGRSSSRNDLTTLTARCENGDIDYKRLYEQAIADNDRLKDKLRKTDEELRDTKQTLEKLNTVTSKNSLSELEKRERRAMERKLSEMEEELKHQDLLKTENQRLKDENGALIRVISKLSK